jgi:hypothetical protein
MPATASGTAQSHHHDHQTMQCMEIWGGNQLVDTSVTMPGLDAWVYSKPFGGSDAGGGDVHYVSSCATGRIARLLLADVSGHGAQVCDVAAGLRSLMRRFVNYIDQGQFVRSMNRQFVEMSATSCFATAVVTTFFAPTRSLSICNAGHPAPMLYRASEKAWHLLRLDEASNDAKPVDSPRNLPLGIEDVGDYEQFDVTLDPGDLVVCYTDSLIEAFDASGEQLGEEGLLKLVRELGDVPPESLIPSLLSKISLLHPRNLQDDDVTVLLYRATGEGRQPSFLTNLLAPIRVGWASLLSLLPGGQPAPLPEMSLANLGGPMFERFVKSRRKRIAFRSVSK